MEENSNSSNLDLNDIMSTDFVLFDNNQDQETTVDNQSSTNQSNPNNYHQFALPNHIYPYVSPFQYNYISPHISPLYSPFIPSPTSFIGDSPSQTSSSATSLFEEATSLFPPMDTNTDEPTVTLTINQLSALLTASAKTGVVNVDDALTCIGQSPSKSLPLSLPPNTSEPPTKKRKKDPSTHLHSCSLCPKTFSRHFNMKTHEKTHDPNRPRDYVCTICTKGFVRIHDLNRHMKIHTKPK